MTEKPSSGEADPPHPVADDEAVPAVGSSGPSKTKKKPGKKAGKKPAKKKKK